MLTSFAATDPPAASVLERRPEPKSAPLITVTMWKMIIGQAIYQLVITFILNFAGESILTSMNIFHDGATDLKTELKTVVFNTFVWMQIFNQYNSRRLDNKFNIFEGMFRNYWFLGIQLIIIGGQVLIIFVGGQAFSITRLNGSEWAVSLILGVISIPVAVIIRLIPDEFVRRLIPTFWKRKKRQSPQVLVSDEDRRYEWNPGLEEIRDQLTFIKTVRGGRLKHIKHKLQHPETLLPRSRSGSRSREESLFSASNGDIETSSPPPATPESRSRNRTRSRSNSAFGPAAAMAGVIAGSIAGWSPVERNAGEQEAWHLSSTSPHSGLDRQQGIDIHPETAQDDPIIVDNLDLSSSTPPSQNPDLIPVFEHAPPDRVPSRGRPSTSRRSRSNTVTTFNSRRSTSHSQAPQ